MLFQSEYQIPCFLRYLVFCSNFLPQKSRNHFKHIVQTHSCDLNITLISSYFVRNYVIAGQIPRRVLWVDGDVNAKGETIE